MNKTTSLLTLGRKLKGNDLYLLSVIDMEPSGIIISAYNQIDCKEYQLPVKETEMSKSGYTRSAASLTELLESIVLVPQGSGYVLQSTDENISKIKATPSGNEIDNILKASMSNCKESVNDVLIKGLVELCKEKPVGLDAVQWLGNWLLQNNPNKPQVIDPDE